MGRASSCNSDTTAELVIPEATASFLPAEGSKRVAPTGYLKAVTAVGIRESNHLRYICALEVCGFHN